MLERLNEEIKRALRVRHGSFATGELPTFGPSLCAAARAGSTIIATCNMEFLRRKNCATAA